MPRVGKTTTFNQSGSMERTGRFPISCEPLINVESKSVSSQQQPLPQRQLRIYFITSLIKTHSAIVIIIIIIIITIIIITIIIIIIIIIIPPPPTTILIIIITV